MQAEEASTLAASLLRSGRPAEAARLLAPICRSEGAGATAWFLYGVCLHQAGDLGTALEAFSKAADLAPDNAEAWSAKAAVLLDLNRPEEALEAGNAALALRPESPEAFHNTARILEDLEHFDAALAGYRRALELDPDFLPALLNRGILLARMQRLEAAEAAMTEALTRYPAEAECWCLLGDVLIALLRPEEALAAFQQAVNLNAGHLPAQMGRAIALSALARLEEAQDGMQRIQAQDAAFFAGFKSPLLTDHVEKSLARDPRRIYCAMQFQRLERCDWSQRDDFLDNLRTLLEHPEMFPTPLADRSLPHPVFALELEAPLRKRMVRLVADSVAAEARQLAGAYRSSGTPKERKRLRIGYVSPDFRRHATAFLTRQLFSAHDRERCEVLAYALHPGDESDVEMSIRRGCDRYRQVASLDSASIVRQIRADQVDILVDLAGYTRHTRPEIFAARCAPVQVGYLGYPGTLGGAALDYAVVDAVVCPGGSDRHWSEALVRIPAPYAIYDDATPVGLPSTRAAHGLPDRALVLCCFNTTWKISPQIFSAWMRLLHRLPNAVLWLWSGLPQFGLNLLAEAKRCGIDADRLVFAGPREHAAHLARYPLADLFLDTLPCNAHTTAADALWMGLPMVTCLGDEMQGRVAASLLHAAGMAELVTSNLIEYEDLVYRLAREPGVLSGLRERLAARRRAGELFNTRRKVRDLERAYRMMWQRHCDGLPPAAFDVPEEALS